MANWYSRLTSGFESWFPIENGITAEADFAATYQVVEAISTDLEGLYNVGDTTGEPIGWFPRLTGGYNTWAGAATGGDVGVIDGEAVFPTSVEATLVASYSVALAAQADLVAVYTVRTSAEQDLSAAWDVTAAVTSDLAATYDVNPAATSVQSDLVATWGLSASAERDLSALWNLTAPVQQDLAGDYNVTEAVQQDLTATWTILTSPLSASSDLVAAWDIANSATRDLVGTFDILADTVTKDLTAEWNVRTSAQADLVTFWQTSAGVASNLVALYSVAGINLKRRAKASTYGPRMVVYEPQETDITHMSGSEAQAFQ